MRRPLKTHGSNEVQRESARNRAYDFRRQMRFESLEKRELLATDVMGETQGFDVRDELNAEIQQASPIALAKSETQVANQKSLVVRSLKFTSSDSSLVAMSEDPSDVYFDYGKQMIELDASRIWTLRTLGDSIFTALPAINERGQVSFRLSGKSGASGAGSIVLEAEDETIQWNIQLQNDTTYSSTDSLTLEQVRSWDRLDNRLAEGEGSSVGSSASSGGGIIGGSSGTRLTISTVDSEAAENHVFYCPEPANPGAFKVTLTQGTWAGGNITVNLSGSATPGDDYNLATGQTSSTTATFFLPAIPVVGLFHIIGVIAVDDKIEPGFVEASGKTEQATKSAIITGPSIYVSGTASISILDLKEKPTLETPFATAREMPKPLLPENPTSMPDGTFGQFELVPESGKTICSSFYWELDESSAKAATRGTDYTLVDDDPSPLIFTQPYPVTFPWLWRSNSRIATDPQKAKLRVVAYEDGVLEDTETVKARAVAAIHPNYVSDPNQPPTAPSEEFQIKTDWKTVNIINDYQDGSVESDSKSSCSCSCPTCVDGNEVSPDLSSGSVKVGLLGGLISATSSSQEGLFPVMQVGMKLPAGRAVPSSLQVKLNVVEPDMDAKNSPVGLGRKTVATNPQVSPTVTFSVPAGTAPGSTLWFTMQADLTAHAKAWTGSIAQERLLPLEFFVSANFNAGTNAASTFSGFIARTTQLLRDERASNISPTLGGNLTLGGMDRLIRNTMIMVPDISNGGSSLGKVIYQQGSMLVRAGGGYTWFANNSGSGPESQDMLIGDVITDSRGNKKRFNTLGQMIEMELATGDKTTFNYLTDGSIQRITDPRGQQTNFTYLPGANNTKRLLIKTTNSGGNDTNYDLLWTPVTSTGGSLTITYDDPDGTGPRLARQDLITYDKYGLINTLRSGDVNGLTRMTQISYEISTDSSGVANRGTRRVLNINYPDNNRRVFIKSVARNQGVVTAWGTSNSISATDPRALRATSGSSNPTDNYTVIQESQGPLGSSALATSVYQLDQRGRVLRYWDAEQIESLGIASTLTVLAANESLGISASAANTLVANRNRSWEYNRQATQRNSFGTVIGTDWGEVLSTVAPQTSSGRQTITWSYSNNNPTSQQLPGQSAESLTWNNTFGVLTKSIDEYQNVFDQGIDSFGRITSQSWSQGSAKWQNPNWNLDVNNDGNLTPSDVLVIINLLNAGGGGPVPQAPAAPPPYYDVNGDDSITPIDSLLIINALNAGGATPPGKQNVTYTYNTQVGLPNYLVTQSTVKTGRSEGDLVTNYSYINFPNNQAIHGRLNQVTQVTASGNATTTYHYDSRGNVDQISDPVGRITRMWYDNLDRLVARMTPDPDGTGQLLPVLERWDYDIFNNVIATEVINSTIQNNLLVVTALKTGYRYDSLNRLTEINTQNPNIKWYLTQGPSGIVESTTAPTTTSTITSTALEAYAFGNSRITNAPSLTVPAQLGWRQVTTYFANPGEIKVTESNSNAAGRTTTYLLDRLNRLKQEITPPTGGGVINAAGVAITTGLTTSYAYDAIDNISSVTDPLGNITSFTYDQLNRPLTVTQPAPTTTPPSSPIVSQFSYESIARKGLKINAIDPLGNTVSTQQDMHGRTIAVTGNTPNYTMEYWLDGAVKRVTDAASQSTLYDYDRRGLLKSITAPSPGNGEASSVSSFVYALDGQLLKSIDPLLRETSYTVDAGGRVTRVTQPDPDGTGPQVAPFQQLTLDSLGNVMASADALGQTTRYTRDAWFRTLTSTDPASAVTSTVYDVFGNVSSVTDPLNNQTLYTYNNLDWLLSENKAVTGGARNYSYDSLGNVRRLIDRNARTTTWTYDNLSRPISEVWTTGTTTNRTLSYTYDAASRMTAATDSDSLAPNFAFAYNTRGEMVGEQQTHKLMAGSNVLFSRIYDSLGNQTTLSANLGGSMSATGIISGGVWDFLNSMSYDGMGRQKSVTQSNSTGSNAVSAKTATFQYDAASQLTDVRRYAATTADAASLKIHSRNTFDGLGRLTSITHGKTEIAAGQNWSGTSAVPVSLGTTNMLAAYSLTYDADNRITALASWRDAFSTAYTYNTTDQLTAAVSTAIAGLTLPNPLPAAESYNLDANGNRRTATGVSQSAAGTHNRLQTDGSFNYIYDNEGNVTRRTRIVGGQVTDYTWDHRNRLTSVTERVSATGAITKKVEYVYDLFDQRVGKRLDIGTIGTWDRYEEYIWADGQEVLRMVDSDGQGTAQPFRLTDRYLWGPAVDQLLADEQYAAGAGPAVGATTASTTAGANYWALTDNLGSVRDLVDNNGVIREHNVYDSFGRLVREVDYNAAGTVIASTDPAAVDTLFGYTARDFDADVNLQYNRARWYDATNGRWLSQDPIGFAAGDANLYRYVGNQATRATDPSGRVLIVIDGTGSTDWFADRKSFDQTTNRRKSHSHNFFRDYPLAKGESAYFLHGPIYTTFGEDCPKIFEQATKYLDRELTIDPTQTINIVGHSRGGFVALQLAWYLKSKGYRVNFLGLYDAVDRTPTMGSDHRIPSNVDHAAHAIRNPNVGSRKAFGNADGGPEDLTKMKSCERELFFGTHAAIGGAPWSSNEKLKATSKSIDEYVAKEVDIWMRERARKAGIDMPPGGIPFPDDMPAAPWRVGE